MAEIRDKVMNTVNVRISTRTRALAFTTQMKDRQRATHVTLKNGKIAKQFENMVHNL